MTALHKEQALSVRLGDTLELVLLLDGVGVRGTLSSVDELVSKALSNGLDVAERGLTSTLGEEGDGLEKAERNTEQSAQCQLRREKEMMDDGATS